MRFTNDIHHQSVYALLSHIELTWAIIQTNWKLWTTLTSQYTFNQASHSTSIQYTFPTKTRKTTSRQNPHNRKISILNNSGRLQCIETIRKKEIPNLKIEEMIQALQFFKNSKPISSLRLRAPHPSRQHSRDASIFSWEANDMFHQRLAPIRHLRRQLRDSKLLRIAQLGARPSPIKRRPLHLSNSISTISADIYSIGKQKLVRMGFPNSECWVVKQNWSFVA